MRRLRVVRDLETVSDRVPNAQAETAEGQKPLSLLLVDDDVELCEMMREFFTQAGHCLECVCNGREGLATALRGGYDLVILDVMLPGIDGLAVLEQLRSRKDLPVIMLTARVQRHERILGLNLGADDYLPKPFDPDELMARIRAVLRRTEATSRQSEEAVTFGKVRVNVATREVWSAGEPVELTAMEFDLLELLIRSAGRVVSREEISALLFEREATPYDRFLDVHISHLRKKLEGGRKLIRTIRGVGYVFTGTS
jgi:DNA-binding response OmpR family regulator